jgi:hypothetical protein
MNKKLKNKIFFKKQFKFRIEKNTVTNLFFLLRFMCFSMNESNQQPQKCSCLTVAESRSFFYFNSLLNQTFCE